MDDSPEDRFVRLGRSYQPGDAKTWQAHLERAGIEARNRGEWLEVRWRDYDRAYSSLAQAEAYLIWATSPGEKHEISIDSRLLAATAVVIAFGVLAAFLLNALWALALLAPFAAYAFYRQWNPKRF